MLTGTIVCLPDQHDPAFDLWLFAFQKCGELRRRRPIRHLQLIGLRGHRAVGAGRPGEHFARQLILDRRGDVRREALVDPAGVTEVPRLEVAVGKAPRLHLLDRPLAGGLQARRSGDARTVDVGQHVQRLHDLRVAVLFLANPGVDVGVGPRLGGQRREQGEHQGQRGKASEHGQMLTVRGESPAGIRPTCIPLAVNFQPPAAYIEGNDDKNDDLDGDAAGRGAGRSRRGPGPGEAGRDPAGRGGPGAGSSSPADERNARDTKERLREIFEQYPPSVAQVLRLDPSLLSRADYLALYPTLANFLSQHPEVAHNPVFFLGGVGGGATVLRHAGRRATRSKTSSSASRS